MLLNKTIIAGKLTADPQTRYTANGVAVCRFRLSVKSKNGKSFVSCVAWSGLAKICQEYLKKGKLIAVEGELSIKSYKNKQGKAVSKTEIIVENLQMLDTKSLTGSCKGMKA